MLKSVLRIGVIGLLAAAIAGMPAQLLAQSTNNPTAAKKTSVAKKDAAPNSKAAHPFHGKLAAVDKVVKTIKVGESVYQITSETKITKDGKPATLDEGVIGEPVSGYVKPAEGGKMAATSVHFGAKADAKAGSKKKEQ
ncbi:MAG: hypothetical protein ACLQU3_06530 [Limisphaerales bacterium]